MLRKAETYLALLDGRWSGVEIRQAYLTPFKNASLKMRCIFFDF